MAHPPCGAGHRHFYEILHCPDCQQLFREQANRAAKRIVDELRAAEPITYAKAGGPPLNWRNLDVLDEHGAKVDWVLEVDTKEGGISQALKGANGRMLMDGDQLVTARVYGRFRIVERQPKADPIP